MARLVCALLLLLLLLCTVPPATALTGIYCEITFASAGAESMLPD